MESESMDGYEFQVENIQNIDAINLDQSDESYKNFESNPLFQKIQENLIKSISLKLWLVNLLQEGGVKEEQFNEMFKKYDAETQKFMDQRDEMLKHARDLAPLEKALNEAKVYLEELKMKKALGLISDDEYNVKEPLYEWDIAHYEEEISKRREEIAFLEDPTRVVSIEEIVKVKEMAERCRTTMKDLDLTSNISVENTEKVNTSLENVLSYLRGFSCWEEKELRWRPPKVHEQEEKQPSWRPPDVFEWKEKIFKLKEKPRAREKPKKVEEKTKMTRVECPYHDNDGIKCGIVAFGRKEDDAYNKLEAHIAKSHPGKLEEFRKTRVTY